MGQHVQEVLHFFFVDELFVFRPEKFIQIKSEFRMLVFRQVHALLDLALDHMGQLIGVQIQPGQFPIGIAPLGVFVPVGLGFLFIFIGPVENLIRPEFVTGNGLERRSGKVQGKFPLNFVKSHIRFVGIHPFMGFVDDQQVPFLFCDPVQLVILSAKIDGPFQPLETFKGNLTLDSVIHRVRQCFQILFPAEISGFPF